jgi:glycosyltransferase involved in cell wall biosynthesis
MIENRLKVLHVIDSLGVGGAERLLRQVIKELARFYEQHIIVLNKPHTLLSELTGIAKITTLDFIYYKNSFKTKRFIRKYVKDNEISVVHSHLYWSNIITRLATTKNIKVFNTIHSISSDATYKHNRFFLYLEKFTYKKNHQIIGVSKEVLVDFEKWIGLKGQSSVLYNPIEDEFFASFSKKGLSGSELRLIAVGSLTTPKNYPYLIEAFKKMPREISIDIYGEGALRSYIQEEIDKYDLNIRLCGIKDDLYKVLPQYDAFVMCSWYEGFSLALMEAMAAGLPPILSDIPVLREAAGEAAIYVNNRKPEDLVEKINRLIQDKKRFTELSQQAFERASSLSRKEYHIKKLIELYES